MVEKKNEVKGKTWARPELKRIVAGAAEQGPANINEDGGPTLDPRS